MVAFAKRVMVAGAALVALGGPAMANTTTKPDVVAYTTSKPDVVAYTTSKPDVVAYTTSKPDTMC